MIVGIAYLLLIIESSCKYLPKTSLPKYGSSHIAFHKYIAVINSIPHHVLIVYSNLYCSGSLVRSRIVVTAASCLEKRNENTSVIVKVGSTLVTGLGQVIEVLDIKTHEYFGHNTNRNNDIAILMLKNLKTHYMNVLLWSEMVVMSQVECMKVYAHLITSSNFCVKYQPDRQLSDNGGPAEYDKLLVGIVSFGAAKSEEPFVAVLTNISYFNRWIMLNTKRFLKKYCVPPQLNESSLSDHDQDIAVP